MMPRVRPGVFEVRASARRPTSRLSSVDLPTLERPAMAISGGPGRRQRRARAHLHQEVRGQHRGRFGQERIALQRYDVRVADAWSDKLKLVGLTGGIGSGKSTVGSMVQAAGGAADRRRPAGARGGGSRARPALAEIARRVARGHRRRRHRWTARRLGAQVFTDPAARRRAGGHHPPAHPAIACASRWRRWPRQGHRLVFYEASLLVEAGRASEFDALVVVTASEEQQLARTMARDGIQPRAGAGPPARPAAAGGEAASWPRT